MISKQEIFNKLRTDTSAMTSYMLPLIDILYDTVINSKAKVVVELGTGWGVSTTVFATACRDIGGHIYTVDIHGDVCPSTGKECLEQFDLKQYITFNTLTDDMEFVKEWNTCIDVLFIDTSHHAEHTRLELEEWGKFVRSGGVILLHDTLLTPAGTSSGGVQDGVNAFLKTHPEYTYRNIAQGTGLGILEKS